MSIHRRRHGLALSLATALAALGIAPALAQNQAPTQTWPYRPIKLVIPCPPGGSSDMHPSVPANNLKELVALSRTAQLNFAVTASGSTAHLSGLALQRAVGARWEYVPYKGGIQAVQDTVAGQTQVLMNGMLATLPQVQGAEVVTMASTEQDRFFNTERARWAQVVTQAQIKLD